MYVDIFETDSRYRVIYADPPWAYRNRRTGGSMKSGSADKYPVLGLDVLSLFPVKDIALKDSVLFLWATVPLLPDATTLLGNWGFEYKTAVFWRKIMSLGLGFWFRGQVELCLPGVRGRVKPFRLQRANFIQSKALRHSEKPIEMRELIEATGLTPRIELFARRKIDGWDCYGDEVE